MKNWLTNKTIVISGASSGIGKDLAKIFIEKYSCKVIGIARSEKKFENLVKELKDSSKFSFKLFDVSKLENWENFSNFLKENKINIDLLINCAGQLPAFDKFENYSIEETEQIMNINYFSCVYSIKTLLPLIINSSTPGIINIASSAPLCPIAGASIYSDSKASLKALTESLIYELRKKCYVSLICPGFTKTDIFRNQDEVDESKLMNFISTDSIKMANKIIKAIARKRKRKVLGKDAKLMDLFYRVCPKTAMRTCNAVLKKSNIKLFKRVYR